jgi:hypothetical protein
MVPEGEGGGHKRENYFYICILERIFYNETSGQFQTWYKHLLMGIQVYSNVGPNPLQRGIITKVQK